MVYTSRQVKKYEKNLYEVNDLNFSKSKKFFAAAVLGAFAFSFPLTVDARVHDPKIETKTSVERKPTLRERVTATMNQFKSPEEKTFNAFEKSDKPDLEKYYAMREPLNEQNYSQPKENSEPQNFSVPKTVSASDTSIIGTPMATQQQCVKYLLRNNPYPNLPVSAEEIVAYYYEEGLREGIRPDVAFAQALKETGFFRYGGDVIPEQNNYCGLGTTGGGVKGEFFATPQLGVRAHIQHLLAYSSTRQPTTPVVDPRYSLVRQSYGSRTVGRWQDLNGRWAAPGIHYGQDILSMFKAILNQ